ncbi:MAG TPA: penicillin-binding protein 2 [Gemmatimonadota bacterium]|nr:penicillin-binding protein 2 [Gemmatimonadota bacterium]
MLVTTVLLLAGAFFRLQVLHSSSYELRSERNRLRAITVPAPRGTMYDRNGRIVAENVPGYSVSLLPGRPDTVRATLARLSPILGLSEDEQRELMRKYRALPQRPLLVSDDATFEQVSSIEERRPDFRRAVVDMRPRRRYPDGRVIAHVVGYVGEISESELQEPAFEGYDAGRIVGKAGLEREYEGTLGGDPGVRYVEVNALGSIVREMGPGPAVAPVPGHDLALGLDMDLQDFADSTFPASHKGGVVALDPHTGEVLLFYSHPSFDPNDFVGGVDLDTWTQLRTDSAKPLLNRVTGAAYPPGSTWKPVVAAMAMRRDLVSIGDHMDIPCRGALRYGIRVWRCWKPDGHGSLSLAGAIQQSCDVYFYQLGMKLGLDAMMDGAARMRFGHSTGIDLPHESSGYFPTSRGWYDRRYGPRGWTDAVVLNLAIGQGENQESLLQNALFYEALATGRRPIVPHLVRSQALEARRVDWSVDISEAQRLQLVDALVRVVNEPHGTAYPWRLERWKIAGKTGTAQNPHGEPHSWFVGFAPAHDPDIVVAALVENGHPDNQTSLAVPYTSAIIRRYLEEIHPAPADTTARAETAARAGGAATAQAGGPADGGPGPAPGGR